MRIARIETCALAEFEDAITCIIFFQGCENDCNFCQNPQLIPKEGGEEMTWQQVMVKLQLNYIDWLSLSGGEALAQKDWNGICMLLNSVKQYKPSLKINLDASSYAVMKHAWSLVGISRHLDCMSVDIKWWDVRHLRELFGWVGDCELQGKVRYRTVIMGMFPFKEEIAKMLLSRGVKDVKMLPNSMNGRGAFLPPVKRELLSDIHEYYAAHGVDFHC